MRQIVTAALVVVLCMTAPMADGSGPGSPAKSTAAAKQYKALLKAYEEEEDAREFAGRFEFASVYDSVEAMFAHEKLDGVVAVTPIDLTGQVVGELLSHPVRLLLEKPPGKDSGEARQLLGIAYLASCRGGSGDPSFSRRIAEYALL